MYEQLEFDFDAPTLVAINNRWVKSEIRNCNVCGKDYIYYLEGAPTKDEYAGPNFCCEKCWRLGFVLIMKGTTHFHKLCEINEITMADIVNAEKEAATRSFPYLHRMNNLVKSS